MWNKILFICISCFLVLNGYGQNAYRFKADITLKIKNPDSTFQYTKGVVRYDKNYKKIVYDISFPQKEEYVSADTLIYKYQNNRFISAKGNPLKPEFSIFHFILNNDISDFGLQSSAYKITSIEKSNDLIITKWAAPESPDFPLGNIIISSKNKRLETVVIYGRKGEILSRQIFKKYVFNNGIEIPTEILAVNYFQGKKTYQIIQFSKIAVNEQGNDLDYDFQIGKKL